jgi:hypothetical protein
MLATTEQLLAKGFGKYVFKNWNFAAIFEGTPAKRYALMNKALKKGDIIQLCRGHYILNRKYHAENMSQFYIAGQLVAGSFISAETALSFHGWIPERVNVIISVIEKGRSKTFNTMMGEFQYFKVVSNEFEFLTGVVRQELAGTPFLIATPLRALADYVYIRKINWTGLNYLLEGLRIEREELEAITTQMFDELMAVYPSKRVLSFLQKLRKSLEK